MLKSLVLRHRRAPGDIVCFTALIRDIKAAYPDISLDVDSTCKELWENNPHLSKTPLWNHNKDNPKVTVPGTRFINCTYGQGIKDQKKETIHFISYFHRDFESKTGLKVPLTLPYGDLHLTEAEKTVRPVDGRYWVMLSGGKSDFTIKVWHTKSFQRVVCELRERGIQIVQIGGNAAGHWHPTLKGVLDLRDRGDVRVDLRQMLPFIYHSDGVICGVTAAMHMAAALHRPCVCIAGGREAYWWEAYVRENSGLGGLEVASKLPVPHKFLHTIGLLDCCKYHGCWKNKVVKISEDASLCKYPIHTPEMPVAKCMHMITPKHVVEAVMSYYEDKFLPPVTPEAETPAISDNQEPPPTTLQLTAAAKTHVLQQPVRKGIAVTPGTAATRISDVPVLDHPDVGSRMTVFVLFYGGEQYYDLHKRCLESIIHTVPAERMDLRVGSNQLNDRSAAMLDDYVARKQITKHYRHLGNDMKYPVMREMFFDTSLPIRTKWVLWFDDDSVCDRNPDWFTLLAQQIIASHRPHNTHMLGSRLSWTLTANQRNILQTRAWYTGKSWQNAAGKTVPGGTKIVFATGGFWAITNEAIVKCNIPDLSTGLTHNGGDWQIGCQLYQQGFNLKQFNGNKQYVNTSSVPRRGITVPMIGKSAHPPTQSGPHVTTPPEADHLVVTIAPVSAPISGLVRL